MNAWLIEIDSFIREVVVHIIHDDHAVTILVFRPKILIHDDLIQNVPYSPRICEVRPVAEVLHDVQKPIQSFIVYGVTFLFQERLRDEAQFFSGVIREFQRELNPRFKAWICADHFDHFISVASQYSAELTSAVFHFF